MLYSQRLEQTTSHSFKFLSAKNFKVGLDFCFGFVVVFFLGGGCGGEFDFLGVFCASVPTATLGNFATLISKQSVDSNICWGFSCLVGFCFFK